MVISPVTVCVIRMSIIAIEQHPCSGPTIQKVRVFMIGWLSESCWVSPSCQDIRLKVALPPWWELQKWVPPWKAGKRHTGDLFTFLFVLFYWPVENAIGFWKCLHCFKVHQVVTPIAASVPDMDIFLFFPWEIVRSHHFFNFIFQKVDVQYYFVLVLCVQHSGEAIIYLTKCSPWYFTYLTT